MQFIRNVLGRLSTRFDPETMEAAVAELAGNLIVAGITFLAFYLVARALDWVVPRVLTKLGVNETTRSFVSTVTRLVLLTIGTVAALAEMGINTPALITSLGVAGLTIGFAARDALSNVVSGFFIFWDRPFVLGDLIDFDGGHGRVNKISLRATRVVTPDGRMISIPNSVVLNGPVTSYTNFPHLRIDVPVSVGVGEDLGRIRNILLDLTRSDPDYLGDPVPRVAVTRLGDYFVEIELRVWLDNERNHLLKRPELRERVFEALRDAGVQMPFETLAIEPIELRATEAVEDGR